MKRTACIIILCILTVFCVLPQESAKPEATLLFNGIVVDAATLKPIPGSQILINRFLLSVSDERGEFVFRVNKNDTVVFRVLGYKTTQFFVSDTLSGKEFTAGIYMYTDTISIGEVVILPRLINLKSEMLKPIPVSTPELENAKYNLAVSAYQGRYGQNKLGDPESNYDVLRRKQRVDASEKGGIPSDRILGLSPLMLIPAAYLLLNGFPEKPPVMKPDITPHEIDQINKKYLENLKMKNP